MHGITDDPFQARDAIDLSPPGAVDSHTLQLRLQAGDEQVFSSLVRNWSPLMGKVARGFVSTDASAQEVVQDAWLAVIRGLASFEGRCTLRTWVFRILINTAKTRGLKEQRTTPQSSLPPDDETGPTVAPGRFHGPGSWRRPGQWTTAGRPQQWDTDPEAAVLSREVSDLVSATVQALPGRQREVVLLRDIHGFTSEEVCELLGVTAQNQRVLLHRGRAKVRAALEVYYAGNIP